MSQQEYWALQGLVGLPVRAAIRILQFLLAVVVIALVSTDLASVNSTTNSKHIYALVAGVASILVDISHCLATLQSPAWLFLDFVMAVLWAALAGAMGSNSTEGSQRQRIRATVGIGITCVALWMVSCILGCALCWTARKSRKAEKGKTIELAETV